MQRGVRSHRKLMQDLKEAQEKMRDIGWLAFLEEKQDKRRAWDVFIFHGSATILYWFIFMALDFNYAVCFCISISVVLLTWQFISRYIVDEQKITRMLLKQNLEYLKLRDVQNADNYAEAWEKLENKSKELVSENLTNKSDGPGGWIPEKSIGAVSIWLVLSAAGIAIGYQFSIHDHIFLPY